MNFLLQQWRRMAYALSGVRYALFYDTSYRSQVLGGALAIGLFVWWQTPLSSNEVLFLCLAYALILITELQNSSFEKALDHLHPSMHENVGKSKDMAAAAVLTAGVFLLVVMIVIVLT